MKVSPGLFIFFPGWQQCASIVSNLSVISFHPFFLLVTTGSNGSTRPTVTPERHWTRVYDAKQRNKLAPVVVNRSYSTAASCRVTPPSLLSPFLYFLFFGGGATRHSSRSENHRKLCIKRMYCVKNGLNVSCTSRKASTSKTWESLLCYIFNHIQV